MLQHPSSFIARHKRQLACAALGALSELPKPLHSKSDSTLSSGHDWDVALLTVLLQLPLRWAGTGSLQSMLQDCSGMLTLSDLTGLCRCSATILGHLQLKQMNFLALVWMTHEYEHVMSCHVQAARQTSTLLLFSIQGEEAADIHS